MGPYTGQPFPGAIVSQPVSTLSIGNGAHLEIHEMPEHIVPVIILRVADGSVAWARLLVPESTERHGEAAAFIRNLRFTKLKRSSSGYRVFIICDWAAGREGGIIYLNRDFSFESFGLSW